MKESTTTDMIVVSRLDHVQQGCLNSGGCDFRVILTIDSHLDEADMNS